MLRTKLFRHWTYRVTAIYIGLFAISVLTLLGFVYAVTIGLIDRQINATILADINSLSERYSEHGPEGLTEMIGERIAADRVGDAIYLLVDGEFNVVAGNLPRWPTDTERQDRWVTFDLESTEEGEDGSNSKARAMSFNLTEGFHLLVGRNLRERQLFDTLILQSLFWALAVMAVLALIGGMVMSRDMRSRLEAINRTTKRIMTGDMLQRVPLTGSGDEFDRLSANLNDMLGQIDRLMNAKREVSDNIAHDLRSPLTRLKSKLEIVLLHEHPPEQYRQAIEQAVSETNNILGTFNALLSIAQAEAGTAAGEMMPLDAALLAGDVAELYEPVAEAKGQELAFVAEGEAWVRANRHLLFQAVTNLVDNAIKYTPEGGHVRLQVRRAGDRVEIAVGDSGPGIPEQARERVLERFVRLEWSRTTPGNGLGLSLVSAVAQMHKATLRLEDNAPGLRIVLALGAVAAPVAEAAE